MGKTNLEPEDTTVDPNACWTRLEEAVGGEDPIEVVEACQDMTEWLTKGGVLPSTAVLGELAGVTRTQLLATINLVQQAVESH